jgi:hypothetical protein
VGVVNTIATCLFVGRGGKNVNKILHQGFVLARLMQYPSLAEIIVNPFFKREHSFTRHREADI